MCPYGCIARKRLRRHPEEDFGCVFGVAYRVQDDIMLVRQNSAPHSATVRQSGPQGAMRHSAPNRARSATTEAASSQNARRTSKISQLHRLVASRSATCILVASRLLAAPPAISRLRVRFSAPQGATVRHSAPNRVRSATTEAASSQKARKTS